MTRSSNLAGAAALAVLSLAAAGDGAAHDFWLEPASFAPEPGAVIDVGVRVGDGLVGEPLPRDPEHAREFFLADAGGETRVSGRRGRRPAGRVRLGEAGPAQLVYVSRPSVTELGGDEFDAYLAEVGADEVLLWRAERRLGDERVRETFARCAVALLDVGGAGGFPQRPLGLPLEIVVEGDPRRLAREDALPMRLLARGFPVSGGLVRARHGRDPHARVEARTDDEGRAALPLGLPGPWLLRAVSVSAASERAVAELDADWSSWWASLHLEVGAASPASSEVEERRGGAATSDRDGRGVSPHDRTPRR